MLWIFHKLLLSKKYKIAVLVNLRKLQKLSEAVMHQYMSICC